MKVEWQTEGRREFQTYRVYFHGGVAGKAHYPRLLSNTEQIEVTAMPRKVRQIKADLRALGFYNRSGKGSHTNWVHPSLPMTLITVAGNDGDDCRRYNELELRKARQALAALQRQRKN